MPHSHNVPSDLIPATATPLDPTDSEDHVVEFDISWIGTDLLIFVLSPRWPIVLLPMLHNLEVGGINAVGLGVGVDVGVGVGDGSVPDGVGVGVAVFVGVGVDVFVGVGVGAVADGVGLGVGPVPDGVGVGVLLAEGVGVAVGLGVAVAGNGYTSVLTGTGYAVLLVAGTAESS